ncbi:hypothetical protein C1645_812102 [Glomus cerebriforme]|uniref:HMG box domain-containing protein n=1 Tax=Glomus cerebriforme TaxID=658196 RepID=A0A397TUU9_9GLOM|nr:hypothetical protein C1645_812102 [Glomus cerebriforme]
MLKYKFLLENINQNRLIPPDMDTMVAYFSNPRNKSVTRINGRGLLRYLVSLRGQTLVGINHHDVSKAAVRIWIDLTSNEKAVYTSLSDQIKRIIMQNNNNRQI